MYVMTLLLTIKHMSTYNYDAMVEMVWKEKADQIFAENNIAKRTFRKDPDPEYTKMSEWAHGKILHQYLKDLRLKHTHIGNESGQAWTKNIVIMMAKKKAQGTSKWFPDYIITIPTASSYVTLYIELKKARGVNGGLNGSTIDPEQVEWHDRLNNTIGSFAIFCHWSNEAIAWVDKFMNIFHNISDLEAFNLWQKKELK